MADPVLETRNLKKYFNEGSSVVDRLLGRSPTTVRAIDDVNLALHENDALGLIGESGCGKTTMLMTLMGLEEPTRGEIRYRGRDVAGFSRKDWKEFRRNVQVIFQDPFNSLDPKFTIGEALREPLKIHGIGDQEQRVRDVLEQVELNPPEQFIDRLPEHLSGGEKQRVSIARALIIEPDILLADEPVSMLDVSIQASILKLLSRLTDELDISLVYVSHDLSTVSYVCKKISVMYLGRIVETAPTKQLIDDPKHPYTRELVNAIPIPDPHSTRDRTKLEGSTENAITLTEGCRFRDRCPERHDICETTPEYVSVSDDRDVACHLYYDHEAYVSAAEEERDAHVHEKAIKSADDNGAETVVDPDSSSATNPGDLP